MVSDSMRIRIREDVYEGAVRGNGQDRMTITREIAHYVLLIVCGVKFARSFGDTPVVAYKDPEWQAKALAGEIMCPADIIKHMTVEQITHVYDDIILSATCFISDMNNLGAIAN